MARRGRKKGLKRRKKPTTSSSDFSDPESPSRAFQPNLFAGKWTYELPAKLDDPKMNFPEMVRTIKGPELTAEFIRETGLQTPLFVESPEGLRMRMPSNPDTFTVDDVKKSVGARRMVEVVQVSTQRSRQMTVGKFVEYYKSNKNDRKELLNVLSLEFSLTKLEKFIEGPKVVKEVDWVEQIWPADLRQKQRESTNNMHKMMYPKVQNYCLMSVEGCYTDFHLDFGGTSVWYHVLKGEKVFWMIPPTDTNLKLYEEWLLSGPTQDQVFLGDSVEKCHRVHLKAGNTFFIPSGWIHAVYTPADSLVFGGNFLHSYSIPMQLKVYDLEIKTHVQKKFRYPYFIQMLWYVAAHFVEKLCGRSYWRKEVEPTPEAANGEVKEEENYEPPRAWNNEAMRGLVDPWELEGLRELGTWLGALPEDKQKDFPAEKLCKPQHILNDLKMAAYNADLLSVSAKAMACKPSTNRFGSPTATFTHPIPLTMLEMIEKRKAQLTTGLESPEKKVKEEPNFDPLASVIALGHAPLPTALRKPPKLPQALVQRDSDLKLPNPMLEAAAESQFFNFADMAFPSHHLHLRPHQRPPHPMVRQHILPPMKSILKKTASPGHLADVLQLHSQVPVGLQGPLPTVIHRSMLAPEHVLGQPLFAPGQFGFGPSPVVGLTGVPQYMCSVPLVAPAATLATPMVSSGAQDPLGQLAPVMDPPVQLTTTTAVSDASGRSSSLFDADQMNVLETLVKLTETLRQNQ